MFRELEQCMLCPRECGVNRNAGEIGYCGFDANYHVASLFIHHGEEPPVKGAHGICNVFFNGCNLRCTYCQNFQISRSSSKTSRYGLSLLVEKIIECLDMGIEAVGFVSPSHFTPHVLLLIETLNRKGYYPVTVYNTNAYDKPEVLRKFEGLIDVYLPDFKYMDGSAAREYSGASDYPGMAMAAIKEMYRQKGSTVVVNEKGQAITGLIIRHLVLPGHAEDSIKILEWISSELSPSTHISLMSQYYPTACVASHPVLGRPIRQEEYKLVLDAMERLGFYRGWIQDYDSHALYRPDFDRSKPFE